MEILKVKKTFTDGIAIAKAFVLQDNNNVIEKIKIDDSKIDDEIKKFKDALVEVKKDLSVLAKENDIFMAHLELANDDTLMDSCISKIKDDKKNALWSVSDSIEDIALIFDQMEDEYMRARATDIRDIGKRILSYLSGNTANPYKDIKEDVIVIAKDLAPSDTAQMNFSVIKGFITEEGGVTSHVAIMAKNKGVPAIVGCTGIMSKVKNGDMIGFSAYTGDVIINPDEEVLKMINDAKKTQDERKKELQSIINKETKTLSGRKVSVCVNVGSIQDIKEALPINPDGIGLFRTEFLFMESDHFPTEEEQFAVYKEAATLMKGKEVIIRTFDIGGDKALSYFEFPKEDNPFLGYRAIRISLDRKDIFKTQLRAILRASAFGDVKIMFPMIIALDEFDQSKNLVLECMKELDVENVKYKKDINIGMMIETPASVLMADEFAKRADFFSIGTNDLTQYTLAVDRGNTKISHLYNAFNPAVIKSIKRAIECAHAEGKRCGMCGEFASRKEAFDLLNAMELDEFSMSKGSMLEIKSRILKSA